jgi:hypothetical protein
MINLLMGAEKEINFSPSPQPSPSREREFKGGSLLIIFLPPVIIVMVKT